MEEMITETNLFQSLRNNAKRGKSARNDSETNKSVFF